MRMAFLTPRMVPDDVVCRIVAIRLAQFICFLTLILLPQFALAQEDRPPEPESRFVTVDGLRLHYLDFGGEGLPIVFIHAADRGAATWTSFAPRFTDRYRVLALTARGVGESEGNPAPDVAARAGDILGVLEALDIDHAVLIGNSSPAQDMTYLAEHHPDRLAGLVFLANAPPVSGIGEADPTGAWEMALRSDAAGAPTDYRPDYLEGSSEIDVPALTFATERGTRGWENFVLPLMIADAVGASGGEEIADSAARSYFERLATDDVLRAEVRASWEENIVPEIHANEQAFQRAFGEKLGVVRLEVPMVTGYEYMNAPEMIEPHIRRFLDGFRDVIPLRPSDVGSDSVEVLAAAESFLSAFSNLEWEPFHSSFSPSATVFLPFREPWRKEDREEAAAFFRGFFDQIRTAAEGPPYGEIVPEDLRIQMLGDAAVVTFHLPGTGTVGRRTLVFGREAPDGPWRIVHLHASVQQVPEEPEGRDRCPLTKGDAGVGE